MFGQLVRRVTPCHHSLPCSAPPSQLQVALVGAPNVGKSSLVQLLSSGLPEVQNYPFTTRSIKMGHFYVAGRRHQVTGVSGRAAGVKHGGCFVVCQALCIRVAAWQCRSSEHIRQLRPLSKGACPIWGRPMLR